MSERALSEIYELRHYATTTTRSACGLVRPACLTTCREHVTCVHCRDAMKCVTWPPPRPATPTLGESAIRELAELRGRIKALAEDCDQRGLLAVAKALRALLDQPTTPPPK